MTLKRIWHKIYIDPRRRRKMFKWGLPMMDAIDKAMKDNGVPYTLVYGTLLGAVREKGFIKHDCDVDMALWADEDYSKAFAQLEAMGFTRKRSITVDDGRLGHEETFKYHSASVDFFFFYPDGEGKYYGTSFQNQDGCSNWKESIAKAGGLRVYKLPLPMSKETEDTAFEDRTYQVTKDAMNFIVAHYGPGWKVPDPTFVYPRKGENEYIEMPGKIAIIKNWK